MCGYTYSFMLVNIIILSGTFGKYEWEGVAHIEARTIIQSSYQHPQHNLILGWATMRKFQLGASTSSPEAVKQLSPQRQGHRLIKRLTVDIATTYSRCDPRYTCKYGNMPRRLLTEPGEGLHNDGHDNVNSDYIFYMYDEIKNEKKEEDYVVEDLIGKGTFGQVLLCRNDGRRVAVKVVRNRPAYQSQAVIEFQILKEINKAQAKLVQDPGRWRIVRLLDAFVWRKHLCLVFEYLENTLYDALKESQFEGLHFPWIKQWATQILQGLMLFHDMNFIHCDLKPENIMFVQDPKRPNSRLKIIDFGSSCRAKQTVYSYIQSRFYRAPEVILGAQYSNKIDMWSFGCILVELYLGLPIFPGNSMYDQLRKITNILGVPPEHLLKSAKQAHKYFILAEQQPRLKTEPEYEHDTQEKLPPAKNYYKLKSLDELTNSKMLLSEDEFKEHSLFIEFVKGCLQIDPDRRFSARQAYAHRFIQQALGKLL